MNIQHYVLGILFNATQDQVVLIRKNKPEWQRGNLNGIGGKVELNESPIDAVVREFLEETGVATTADMWRCYCTMSGDGFCVYCFTSTNQNAFDAAITIEDEIVDRVRICDIHKTPHNSNLLWLVEMAKDTNDGNFFMASVHYESKAKTESR